MYYFLQKWERGSRENFNCNSLTLQVIIGVLSLTLNLLRDCHLDKEDYARSANAISYFSLACVSIVSVLNIIIGAFDPNSLVK